MLIIFATLLIVASIILGFIILIQNPKGGGLSSSLGGIGNQLMGVKQTTDVLEKGTWLFAAIIGVLCITSALFIPKASGSTQNNQMYDAPTSTPQQQPQNTTPFNGNTQPATPSPNK